MKTNITRTIALLLALLVHQLSLGQTLKQGAYHDRAYGQLTITTADRSGGQKFSIYAEGSNGHACDFDGLVRNGVAELIQKSMRNMDARDDSV